MMHRVARISFLLAAYIGAASTGLTSEPAPQWWAFKPVTAPALPSVHLTNWPRNAIDLFILSHLEKEQLAPSPEAAAATLVRRLYFDLVGLPPSAEQVALYAKNPSERAYAQMVDELLASPAYGERWARHWLDVARFGESDGFERNNVRNNSWPYRDWVIDAFNRDLPYDQFARAQLAGDLSPLAANPNGPSFGDLAAVGFLVAGVHNTVVGASEFMQKTARQDELEELAAAVGQTFLGLTVHCARCHDHKFDPISTAEYYQFISCLDGVQHGEREFTRVEIADELNEIDLILKQWQGELTEIEKPARAKAHANPLAAPEQLPRPLARWEFDTDLKDSIGMLHARALGSAQVRDGALVLNGQGAYAEAGPLPRNLRAKTLTALVALDDLKQQGGGVVSVQARDGSRFDAIVFGERESGRWMAGSEFYNRTRPFNGSEETSNELVHMALVYGEDGRIAAYRNGQPYGQDYSSLVQPFEASDSSVLFGLRHSPPGGNRFLTGRIFQAEIYDRALDAEAIAQCARAASREGISDAMIVAALSGEKRAERKAIKKKLEDLQLRRAQLQTRARGKIYTTTPQRAQVTRVLKRGDVRQPAEEVSPGGLKSLGLTRANFALAADAAEANRRRALADWITGQDNPTFARVMVNRLWHYHFGRGLVETPSDFGVNGGRPSHPLLLDWLANELLARNYSLKSIHRLIVLSSTYRQSSAARPEAMARDADNRWLWRYAPSRLDAESLRDALLAAAGQLNHWGGGPGFKDVDVTFLNGTTYYTPLETIAPETCRRTVYRFTPRGGRSSILDTFDCPDPSTAAPRRTLTTTPLQALSLWNNTLIFQMSEALAKQVRSSGTTADQVSRMFEGVCGRKPRLDESQECVLFVETHGLAALARVLFNSNEFIMVQ